MPHDPHRLDRFIQAQEPIYPTVLSELRSGRKASHWMWFVFPQIEGLGSSPMAQKFAVSSRDEAAAYLRHPVLGPRLRECTELILAVEGCSIHEILGSPDDLKFRSSMTLFAEVAPQDPVFHDALAKYFDGRPDARTLELL